MVMLRTVLGVKLKFASFFTRKAFQIALSDRTEADQ